MLASELQTLRGDARLLWGDAEERRWVLETIVAAWERGDEATLRTAVKRWDDAVVAGLEALGLPRGPIIGPVVQSVGRFWLGRKEASCRLLIDGDVLRSAVRNHGQAEDEVFRVWVHESLHARRLFDLSDTESERRIRGYEEGMVEGLARLVTRQRAGMDILEGSYTSYVKSYEALARALGFDVEALWRRLWREPVGSVRMAFVDAVDEARFRAKGRHLSASQRARLHMLAEQAFASARERDTIGDEGLLRDRWRLALR
jgi:hypothetical protein